MMEAAEKLNQSRIPRLPQFPLLAPNMALVSLMVSRPRR